jgi:tRNA pseudouridine13 synthase
MPELAVKGDNRAVIVIPKKLKLLAAEKDELNKNKFKIILTFELQKGSYATVLIDQLFK